MIATVDQIMTWLCGHHNWIDPKYQMDNTLSVLGEVPDNSRTHLEHLWKVRETNVEYTILGYGEEFTSIMFQGYSTLINKEINNINELRNISIV